MRDDKKTDCCLFLFMQGNLLFESNAVEKSFQILVNLSQPVRWDIFSGAGGSGPGQQEEAEC